MQILLVFVVIGILQAFGGRSGNHYVGMAPQGGVISRMPGSPPMNIKAPELSCLKNN
jgi:hypothetical protein